MHGRYSMIQTVFPWKPWKACFVVPRLVNIELLAIGNNFCTWIWMLLHIICPVFYRCCGDWLIARSVIKLQFISLPIRRALLHYESILRTQYKDASPGHERERNNGCNTNNIVAHWLPLWQVQLLQRKQDHLCMIIQQEKIIMGHKAFLKVL